MNSMNRRQMLGLAGATVLGGVVSHLPAAIADQVSVRGGLFIFDLKSYGVVGDGKTLDSIGINLAIEACTAAGGGTVYVAPGTYLCGTVVLKSNVTLYIEAGATLLGSPNIDDYIKQPTTRKLDNTGESNGWHLIFVRDAENVTIAGPGKIDGQGSNFWTPREKKRPLENYWREIAAFDWEAQAKRPTPMMEFFNCKNLHIKDVQILNSPGWTIRPIHCDNVFIRGISIKNPIYGPNCDGIDLTCCQNVFVSDCLIDVADDAICLKSETSYGEALRVSKNITVTNCVIRGACNGFKFGTRTHCGFENITFSNSVIFNEDVPLRERVISGICIGMVDGGYVEGLLISNIRMQRVRTPIFIRIGNRTPRQDGTVGQLRGVMIENIHATGSILTSSITGMPGFAVEDVTLSNIRIDSDEAGKSDWVSRKIPDLEVAKGYPEASMFGRLPAYGLYCRHVKGLRLHQVEIKSDPKEERPAIFCDDVMDLEIDGMRSTPITGTQPAIKLVQTKQAFIHGCVALSGTSVFLEVQGELSEQIIAMNNNLVGAEKATNLGANVKQTEVILSSNVGASPKA